MLQNIYTHVKIFCLLVISELYLIGFLLFYFQEGFAFAHCTTCKAPYHLRVHLVADRKWRTLKFRFFVTRDIIFIFLAVQLVGHCLFTLSCFLLLESWYETCISFKHFCSFVQVIASLAYLVYLIDGFQQFWLRLAWSFDSELSFYYICGKVSTVEFLCQINNNQYC